MSKNAIPSLNFMLLIFKDIKSCLRFSVSVIARLGDCVAIIAGKGDERR
jgi:hypothetical protein